ncbi:uncharacterized protein CBL_10689 [Carabus blaptoides fortunei]
MNIIIHYVSSCVHLRPATVQPTSNGVTNGVSNRSTSPISPPTTLTRAVSTSALNVVTPPSVNGFAQRRFIPNPGGKGVMQKFFKTRGKISTVSAMTTTTNGTSPKSPVVAWQPPQTTESPAKALIPSDKPLRRGYVPVEERIQKELREMKNREEELKTIRRKSQPDLMAAIEAEQAGSTASSRSVSPVGFITGKLRPARSFSHLLDEDFPEDTVSAPPSLRPARSLAELCDAPDEDIESPRTLIQQWESRIRQSQDEAQMTSSSRYLMRNRRIGKF